MQEDGKSGIFWILDSGGVYFYFFTVSSVKDVTLVIDDKVDRTPK